MRWRKEQMTKPKAKKVDWNWNHCEHCGQKVDAQDRLRQIAEICERHSMNKGQWVLFNPDEIKRIYRLAKGTK